MSVGRPMGMPLILGVSEGAAGSSKAGAVQLMQDSRRQARARTVPRADVAIGARLRAHAAQVSIMQPRSPRSSALALYS
jgi:hypothetical protein